MDIYGKIQVSENWFITKPAVEHLECGEIRAPYMRYCIYLWYLFLE